MSKRFEGYYKTERLDNLGDPEWHNRRWQDIDLRMHTREIDATKIDDAVDRMEAIALARLNDTFSPLIQQAMNQLADVGVSFSGQSLTLETIGEEAKTFIIIPQHRVGLVVVDFVSIRPTGVTDAAMICSVVSYDRQSGALLVDPVDGYITGTGTYHDWQIRVSVTPNLDTYSRGEVDGLFEDLVDGAPADLNTLGKIAGLLGFGPGGGGDAGAIGVLMRANNLSDLLSAAAARANLGLGNVNNTSDATKPVSAPVQAAIAQATAAVFPTGTTMMFYQAVVPTGWIRMTTQHDKAIRVVNSTGGVAGGVQPFSTLFSRTSVDYTTLDGNTLPSHAHGVADPTHAHGVADPGHGHGVGDPTHAHSYDGQYVAGSSLASEGLPQHQHYGGSTTGYAATGIWIGGSGVGIGIYGNYAGIGIYAAGGSVGHTHGFDHRVQYVDVLIGVKS
jgi:hypothetical protein